MSALRNNIEQIAKKAQHKQIRVASKSIRSVKVLQTILGHSSAYQGVMCFTADEALFLAEKGLDDLLIAYPVWDTSQLRAISQRTQKNKRIIVMIDSMEHVKHLVSVKASPETVSIYLGGTCIAQHKRCLERKKTVYDLAHYLPLLEKKGRAILYARPVQETIPESFLHWLRSQDLTSKELVDILRRCQEEDYMEVMQKAPNHIDPVEIQDTVVVQAVDLHLYDAFIHGKAGAAL